MPRRIAPIAEKTEPGGTGPNGAVRVGMKTNRKQDYTSASTHRTRSRQLEISEWLTLFDEGMTVAELAHALGISRQLCLYHVKKLAVSRGLVMQLEPCLDNGGLRYRCWSEAALMAHYVRRFSAPREALRVAA